MSTKNTPTDDALAAGEAALADAQDLFAKAADLDADLSGLDDAKADAEEQDEDEDPRLASGEPPPTDEDFGDAPMGGGDEDEDDEEGDEDEDAPPMMKAVDPGDGTALSVDALPILEALDRNIAALNASLDRIATQQQTILQIAKAQQAALGHFSKAQGALANTPLQPKSARTVTVPTGTPPAAAPDLNTLFAKAYAVVDDPSQLGVIETHFNRRNPEALLAALTPEQREKVLAA